MGADLCEIDMQNVINLCDKVLTKYQEKLAIQNTINASKNTQRQTKQT